MRALKLLLLSAPAHLLPSKPHQEKQEAGGQEAEARATESPKVLSQIIIAASAPSTEAHSFGDARSRVSSDLGHVSTVWGRGLWAGEREVAGEWEGEKGGAEGPLVIVRECHVRQRSSFCTLR